MEERLDLLFLTHITSDELWNVANEGEENDKKYRHPSLDKEGFIHLSTPEQVNGTLNKWFKGNTLPLLPSPSPSASIILTNSLSSSLQSKGTSEVLILHLSLEVLKSSGIELKYEEVYPGQPPFPHFFGPLPVSAVLQVDRVRPSDSEETGVWNVTFS
jgi:uncharacterized protein (DUF952 family)